MNNGYSTEYEVKKDPSTRILDDVYEPKKDPSVKIVGDIYAVRREVEKSYPPSRERSLALTKLDEAALWIKATPLEVYETDI